MAEVSLPAGAVLLGASPGPLALRGAASTAVVQLTAEGQRQLAAPEAAAGQVLLLLEHLRGSQDAAILAIYVGLPAGASPLQHPQLLVGSLGLFGLRLASLPQAGRPGQGRSARFEVTRWLAAPAASPPGPAVHVSFVPNHPLPATADLVLERLSLYYVPPA